MTNTTPIFNRRLLRLHRERAAQTTPPCDFLFAEAAARLAERVEDFGKLFPTALCLGDRLGCLSPQIKTYTDRLIVTDITPPYASLPSETKYITTDEELLPFAPAIFDLAVSPLSLHWVNDLPGTLKQLHYSMKPGGLVILSLLGGTTLTELRQAMAHAAATHNTGLSPRISPFADIKTLAGLLQRAGFSDPVADSDTLTVTYSNPWRLLTDLRAMGESNALTKQRNALTSRRELQQIIGSYQQLFGDHEGAVPASFEIVTLVGWR